MQKNRLDPQPRLRHRERIHQRGRRHPGNQQLRTPALRLEDTEERRTSRIFAARSENERLFEDFDIAARHYLSRPGATIPTRARASSPTPATQSPRRSRLELGYPHRRISFERRSLRKASFCACATGPSKFFRTESTWLLATTTSSCQKGAFTTNTLNQRFDVSFSPGALSIERFRPVERPPRRRSASTCASTGSTVPASDLFIVYNHSWNDS